MTEQCKECGALIAHGELSAAFSSLFFRIEQGAEQVTDVEESIYFNAYCTTCAKHFLVDEQLGYGYDNQ